MANVSKMQLLHGSPIQVSDHCVVRQPSLAEIDALGYELYQQYLSILLVSKQALLNQLGIMDAAVFSQYSLFDILGTIPELCSLLIEAFSFFLVGSFDFRDGFYYLNGIQLAVRELAEIKATIMKISCIECDEEEQHVFASERAREIWEKCRKGREGLKKARRQDENLDLVNLIGAVSAKSGGYTLLNIWDLTVYQLYDQFTRININVQMDIYATRWAAWGKEDFDVSMWFKNILKKEG